MLTEPERSHLGCLFTLFPVNDFQVKTFTVIKTLQCSSCLCRCRKGQWSEGLSWVPSHSPPGHGKRRAPLTCRCTTLQHHQDSRPPPGRTAACRCRLTRRRRSRLQTRSSSPRPLLTAFCSGWTIGVWNGSWSCVWRLAALLVGDRC